MPAPITTTSIGCSMGASSGGMSRAASIAGESSCHQGTGGCGSWAELADGDGNWLLFGCAWGCIGIPLLRPSLVVVATRVDHHKVDAINRVATRVDHHN